MYGALRLDVRDHSSAALYRTMAYNYCMDRSAIAEVLYEIISTFYYILLFNDFICRQRRVVYIQFIGKHLIYLI